jgi:hypothetical protein
MKLLYSLLLITAVGCSSKHAPPAVAGTNLTANPVKPLTDAQKVALLRKQAKYEGLDWEIFCVPKQDDEPRHYEASAVEHGKQTLTYIEEGGGNWWAENGGTPADAAYALYKDIQGPPDFWAPHKPEVVPGGCNYNTVLDSKHANDIPCKEKP